jgi:hypothetical protein
VKDGSKIFFCLTFISDYNCSCDADVCPHGRSLVGCDTSQLYPPICLGVSKKILLSSPVLSSCTLVHRTAPPDDPSRSRTLSLPHSLLSMKRLLWCLSCVASPFSRYSFPQGTRPLPALLRSPVSRPSPPRPSWKGRQGRPAPAPREAYAYTCATTLTH